MPSETWGQLTDTVDQGVWVQRQPLTGTEDKAVKNGES